MEYIANEVRKTYYRKGSKKYTLGIDTFNLNIKTGELIGIIGSSKSGKTTLIDLLSGNTKQTEGTFNYKPKEVSRVYSEHGVKLNKNLTVFDNMVYFGKKLKMSELDVESRMSQLRDIFSLNKYINTKASELSEVNRVKSELAMVLLDHPKMLFIDDAFIYLSNVNRTEVLKCLKRLNKQERTIIVLAATRVSEVDKIINRIIITSKSEIIYDDNIDKFKNKYGTKKMFEISLNKNISINKIDGIDIIESGEYYYKLLFNNENGMFAKVINLFDINSILDLKIADQSLSDVIEDIKRDEDNDKNRIRE